jgi:hypothetical protein
MSWKFLFIVIGMQVAMVPANLAKDESHIGWRLFLYSQSYVMYTMAVFVHAVYFKERDKPNPIPWRNEV